MGLFDGLKKKKIQATEGLQSNMDITSGLMFVRSAEAIPGLVNQYPSYSLQASEIYRKYNGQAEYGCAQLRTIVDTRTAFISGEGIDINSDSDEFNTWVKKFLRETKLSGSGFFKLVMATEMLGRVLLILRPVPGSIPTVEKLPRNIKYKTIGNKLFIGDSDTAIPSEYYVLIETNGDAADDIEPVVKAGLCLTDCDNYDRALRDIRRTNYTTSRITPTFKTTNDAETTQLANKIKEEGWRIGQAFIGKADFKYETAGTGALDNLKIELSSTAKNISATTGIPVHWLGWTDLMSNRATADDLYQTINNATLRERTIISEDIHELLVKAQTLYIDNGGTELREVNRDFNVTIPIIDFGRFEAIVRALSVAYNDGIISDDDYRGFIPGIDPIETKKRLSEKNKPADSLDNLEAVPEENQQEPIHVEVAQ